MALGFLALSGVAIAGIAVGVIVLIVVVAVVLRPKKPSASGASATTEPRIETSPNNMPSMVDPVREETAKLAKPAPKAAGPAPSEVVSTSGRVIQVPTELPAGEPSPHDLAPLEPSLTAEAPLLAEVTLEPTIDDMKIGTDELPSMGTQELPRTPTREVAALADKPRYRTQDARKMQEAIETMKCPKCGQPTFVGRETPDEFSKNGLGMYKLEGRCGSCGHKGQVMDLRIG